MSCQDNQANINETFIIEPIFVGSDSISACTSVYTNEIISCSGDSSIMMSQGVIIFNGNLYTNDSLTANTISATTFFGDGSNLFGINSYALTSSTQNNNTLILFNSTGGTESYTPIFIDTNTFITGGTFNGSTLTLNSNSGTSVVVTGFTSGSAPVSVWSTTGNTGTTSDNFIGNIHNQPLIFRTDNTERLRLNANGNVQIAQNIELSSTTSSVGQIIQNGTRIFGTQGTNNLFLGANAGNISLSTARENVGIGSGVMTGNTTGVGNTAVGFQAMRLATTIGSNTALGAYALWSVTGGNGRHTAIGNSALANLTAATQNQGNTAIGTSALQSTTTGFANNAVGDTALFANTTGSGNNAFGYFALRFNTTGSENISFGTNSMCSNTSGSNNIAIGRDALRNPTGATGNIGIGTTAGNSFTNNDNIALGTNSAQNASSSLQGIFLGWQAGSTVSSASNVINIGTSSGADSSGLNDNINIGTNAGQLSNSISDAIRIGRNSGRSSTTSNSSIFIGLNAGVNAINSSSSVGVGVSAMQNAQALRGVAIGQNAGTSSNGNENIFLGFNSGNLLVGEDNIAIGANAGNSVIGSFNTLIGTKAGSSFTNNVIGSNNIIIGSNVSLLNGLSNAMNIGGVLFGADLAYSDISENPSIMPSNGRIGINVASGNITNTLHVSAATNPVRFEGIQQGDDLEMLTIDSNGVLHKNSISDRLVLRRVDLGGINLNEEILLPNITTKLKNILVSREINDVINKSDFTGCKIDYYYTLNDNVGQRVKTLWTTQTIGVDFDETTIDAMIYYIYGQFSKRIVNFYCEVYLEINRKYLKPTQVKLVNPLFNSLNPNKYSLSGAYLGKKEFIRGVKDNVTLSGYNSPNDPNTIQSNLLSSFSAYYSNTNNDIRKKISQIVLEPTFYGLISAQANAVINSNSDFSLDKEIIINSVYVEQLKNVYGKFKIPVNLHGFYVLNRLRYNNFYGDLLYDVVGGSSSTVQSSATNTLGNSLAFAHFVDTYRLCPFGSPFVINYDKTDDLIKLNDLQYTTMSNRLSYITGRDKSMIQVLPYYNDVYIVEIYVNGTLSPTDSIDFLSTLINSYGVVNDTSLTASNFFDGIITDASQYMSDEATFNSNPFGRYILLQSNDTKMADLAVNNIFSYGTGDVRINAIYKGYTFRPTIFPLNLTQLLLEVPKTEVYPLENTFEIGEKTNSISNKSLRLIINHIKKNKIDVVTLPLKYTVKRTATDNEIFMLEVDNTETIEKIIRDNLSSLKQKSFRPNGVEIYLSFYDNTEMTTSSLADYKIIVENYGNNEIFKLVRVTQPLIGNQ